MPRTNQTANQSNKEEASKNLDMEDNGVPALNNGQTQHERVMTNNNYFSKEEYDKAMEELHQSDEIQMNNEMYAAYYGEIETNIEKYIGKKIKTTGFVYREKGLQSNQLVLARFYMIHCVADTSVLGFFK
ncbi:DUF1980 domain-containing protein [Virgibacillus halophilus]|uniref:DUF1980 domain-containing protein n=1 Tax=Tigheibacillus halophilus TaxID=361280 RepID=A0ABU5CCD7_9BACI|nr:DUF1980 domain-containing protein [Virgibacillus halophilus]